MTTDLIFQMSNFFFKFILVFSWFPLNPKTLTFTCTMTNILKDDDTLTMFAVTHTVSANKSFIEAANLLNVGTTTLKNYLRTRHPPYYWPHRKITLVDAILSVPALVPCHKVELQNIREDLIRYGGRHEPAARTLNKLNKYYASRYKEKYRSLRNTQGDAPELKKECPVLKQEDDELSMCSSTSAAYIPSRELETSTAFSTDVIDYDLAELSQYVLGMSTAIATDIIDYDLDVNCMDIQGIFNH